MDQKAGIIVNIKKADVDSQPNMSSFWLMASVAENRGFTMIYDPNLFFFIGEVYWSMELQAFPTNPPCCHILFQSEKQETGRNLQKVLRLERQVSGSILNISSWIGRRRRSHGVRVEPIVLWRIPLQWIGKGEASPGNSWWNSKLERSISVMINSLSSAIDYWWLFMTMVADAFPSWKPRCALRSLHMVIEIS